VATAVPAMALGPAHLRVPLGPRAGEPVSSTRLALLESTDDPGLHLCMSLIMIMVAAAVLVVLAARGL
jgi:hypothetical protein